MDVGSLSVVVIGASLGGLSAAALLERAGARVSLLERGEVGFEGRGGGLGLSLSLAKRIAQGAPPSLSHARRRVWALGEEREDWIDLSVTSYGALWRWLRGALHRTTVEHQRRAIEVQTSKDDARVITSDAKQIDADLVIAADGGASLLRAQVSPGSERVFSGYVLWRGLVEASALDDERFRLIDRFHIGNTGEHHFVGYTIPNLAGSTAPSERLFNWGWYFRLSPEGLASLRGMLGDSAPHDLERSEGALRVFEEVVSASLKRWPDWIQHIIERTRAQGAISPHPVYECAPERLVRERIVLLGDAAHLASPITGSGARMAMEDAVTLCDALSSRPTLSEALSWYELARLRVTHAIVEEGRRWGASMR